MPSGESEEEREVGWEGGGRERVGWRIEGRERESWMGGRGGKDRHTPDRNPFCHTPLVSPTTAAQITRVAPAPPPLSGGLVPHTLWSTGWKTSVRDSP